MNINILSKLHKDEMNNVYLRSTRINQTKKTLVILYAIISCIICILIVEQKYGDPKLPLNLSVSENKSDEAAAKATISVRFNSERELADESIDVLNTKYGELLNRNVTKVLLLTYYRGGSSFFGQIFAQNPDAFYWFEPLDGIFEWIHTLKSEISETGFQLMPRGMLRSPKQHNISRKNWVIDQVLGCKAQLLNDKVLSSKFFVNGQGMPRMNSFQTCLQTHNATTHPSSCKTAITETCLNSSLVVAKLIRYSMEEVKDLFDIHPDLQVIHYVRDPRAIVASRAQIKWWRGESLMDGASEACEAMFNNQVVFMKLQKKYPSSFKFLKYEHFAARPKDTARDLYSFLGHVYPSAVDDWLDTNTKSAGDDWFFSTRRNSTEVIDKWRKTFSKENIDITTKICKAIIKAWGYNLN